MESGEKMLLLLSRSKNSNGAHIEKSYQQVTKYVYRYKLGFVQAAEDLTQKTMGR